MRRLFPLLFLVLGCVAARCARRAPANSDCEWQAETRPGPLDLSKPAQQRHLSNDAEIAEDLAIRYADAHGGPRSGHFEGFAEYARMRNRCMAGLFQTIAASHAVTASDVFGSLGRRRTDLDLAVMLSFALLYAGAAYLIARRIARRYADDPGSVGPVLMTTYVSVAVSAAGVLSGEQWSGLIETVRLGNGHLSYRGDRIPWGHHRAGLFIAGVIVFWLIAAIEHYRRHRAEGGTA